MSTETALPKRPGRNRRPTARHQLWQVPTFGLGAVALVVVGLTSTLSSQGSSRHIERDLAAARQALAQSQPDLEEASSLAERVLREAPPVSHQAGQAHFLLGSVCLMQAEQASGNSGVALWQQARTHFEQADTLGTTDEDRPRLAYRLGKTYHALNVDPQRVVDCLSWSIPEGADSLFEGYGLLAEAYLRLPEPNLSAALEATKKQLALPKVDEAALAPARLQCGELLCRLNQPDEGRKVLARVGPGAAPNLVFRAKLLRARLSQDEGLWSEAAKLWEEVKADSQWLHADPGRTLYNLGLCYRRLDQVPQALKVWEECRQDGGEEAQAAALEVAVLRLRGEQPTTALECFASALRAVAAPSDYHNPLIDLAEARNRFEAGCQYYRQSGAYEAAQQLARLYERIALPGAGQELAGQAAEAWGRSLLEQVPRAVTDQQARALQQEARQRYSEAGSAYERAADLSTSPVEQTEWLWHSAADYVQGQERDRAVRVLERYVQVPGAPVERLGEAWFLLGQAHQQLHNEFMAQAAYQKCIEYPGPSAYRARYELALTKIEQKNYDDAEAELNHNLGLAPPGSEAHEKSLVTLATLLFQRRNYSAAFIQLQRVLDLYPANPSAARLRLNFAQCCRQLAEQAAERVGDNDYNSPEARAHRLKERDRLLERAGVQYQKLAQDLDSAAANRTLTLEEEATLRQALFAYADCCFELCKYQEALGLYNRLADRYQHQLDELIALRGVWQCHGLLEQWVQVRTTLDRLRSALSAMPAAVLDGTSETATRAYWENWLADKSRLREAAKPATSGPH